MAVPSFAFIARRLLLGPIYADQDREWQAMKEHFTELRRYFSRLELRIVWQDTDGYAFLDDAAHSEEEDPEQVPAERLPTLVRRDKLSYDTTLLCVLLRQRLDEYDAAGMASSGGRLYVTQQDLLDQLDVFFADATNKVSRANRLRKTLVDAEKQGFLLTTRTYPGEDGRTQYEVKRILKARLDNDQLEDFQQQLDQRLATGNSFSA
ncbi:DUF4194 domain-containing protein [Hymenobacter sp. CRA2]|uniref:DUF4194 domain-containing protein n=1 Tax=Hymenobacter sp. CRA2 TaxID=1955620 RepID=UPI00098FB7A2|nr:DUF4194 domain-containing protein [Hymenobacter sp. CRA2]OON65500.1 hypothetical protein B0919_24050 [Hymenobacter sp. CRA2]